MGWNGYSDGESQGRYLTNLVIHRGSAKRCRGRYWVVRDMMLFGLESGREPLMKRCILSERMLLHSQPCINDHYIGGTFSVGSAMLTASSTIMEGREKLAERKLD
jgi:hypothetical protein